jgi:glycosyltransferase involved in cell wall biosynthesis
MGELRAHAVILHAVLPGNIDDPAAPSGGNRYDREVLRRLAGGVTAWSRVAGSDAAEVGSEVSSGLTDVAGIAAARASASGSALAGSAVFDVRETAIPGSWPQPAKSSRTAVTELLESVPDGETVLLDGLVACGIPELLEPHAKRIRLVILVHLPLADETSLTEQAATELSELEKRTLHLASTVIATSTQAARRVEQLHGLSGVHAVAPGVDPAPLAVPSPGGFRLLTVASLTHRKGQDVLVAALKQLSNPPAGATLGAGNSAPDNPVVSGPRATAAPSGNSAPTEPVTPSPRATAAPSGNSAPTEPVTPSPRATAAPSGNSAPTEPVVPGPPAVTPSGGNPAPVDPAWTCTLVGTGPDVPEAIPNVHLAGPLTGAALDAAYANADLFVLPSRAETYGMVVTEALARGLPVVASAVGGVPEALGTAPGGLPGRLVPPDDPGALAAALRDWLTDPDLRERWRAAARARRESLTGWDETARQLAEILDPVAEILGPDGMASTRAGTLAPADGTSVTNSSSPPVGTAGRAIRASAPGRAEAPDT